MRLLSFVLTLGLVAVPLRAAQRLSIDGSRTMYTMDVALVKRFELTHPGITFSVSDNGTAKAFESIAHATADIGAVTRDLRPEDRKILRASGAEAKLVPIALEGISIYVHPRNPLGALSVDNIIGIYSGRITNWKEVGGPDAMIHVYSFDDATGRYWYMFDDIMRRKPMLHGVRFTDAVPSSVRPSQALAIKEQQMLSWVSSDPNAIGFGDLKKIRVVKILRIGATLEAAVLPAPDEIKSGRYPLARKLSFLVRQPPSPAVAEFARWAAEQSDLIRDAGFVPIGD